MPLTNPQFTRIITSDELGIGVGQAVPFTYTHELDEPAQLLNAYWTYMSDANPGTRGPFIDANTDTGFSLGLLWGGNFMGASAVEQNSLPLGEDLVDFFGIVPVPTSIPEQLYLKRDYTMIFTSFFFAGAGDLQDIYFQLGILE